MSEPQTMRRTINLGRSFLLAQPPNIVRINGSARTFQNLTRKRV